MSAPLAASAAAVSSSHAAGGSGSSGRATSINGAVVCRSPQPSAGRLRRCVLIAVCGRSVCVSRTGPVTHSVCTVCMLVSCRLAHSQPYKLSVSCALGWPLMHRQTSRSQHSTHWLSLSAHVRGAASTKLHSATMTLLHLQHADRLSQLSYENLKKSHKLRSLVENLRC